MNCYSDTPLDIAEKYNNEEMINCLYDNENRIKLETENTDSNSSPPCITNEMYCSGSKKMEIENLENSIYLIKISKFNGTVFIIENTNSIK